MLRKHRQTHEPMPKIKNRIARYLTIVFFMMMVLLLLLSVLLHGADARRHVRSDAGYAFRRIEQELDRNQAELENSRREYFESSLRNADSAAYMLQYNPSARDDVQALREIAEHIEVDEIHIFDETGRIISGTNPEYYGYTFDSGEQMGFFKPMLRDKTLRLYQDITPNTAKGKPMQYSAVWSADGTFIVEIGNEPVSVIRATKKNELSYVFSLLNAGAGVDLYAVDSESGQVVGATDESMIGKTYPQIGLPLQKHTSREIYAAFARPNGVMSYCVMTTIQNTHIGYVMPLTVVYRGLAGDSAALVAAMLLVVLVMILLVMRYLDRFVLRSIRKINQTLAEITAGNLQKSVNIRSSIEFHELSSHINEMIESLLSSSSKISFILNKTDVHIGVYEYNTHHKNVRFTDYIPEILALNADELARMASDVRAFRATIERLRTDPLPGEENIYRLPGDKELYVKIDEIVQHHDVFGVVVDMTDEIIARRKLESERDNDPLTGLLNRRGLIDRLSALFDSSDGLTHGVLLMVDADDLKEINDTYGHNQGDLYLQRLGEMICAFGSCENLSARLGGDEFVTVLYGYETEDALQQELQDFLRMQDGHTTVLHNGIEVPIRCSMGYALTCGENSYSALLRKADEMMYQNKRTRKTARNPAEWQ